MAKGQKTGGRKKGTPNRDVAELFAICEKHKIDVFEAMVKLAAEDPDKDSRFDKLLELAPYLYSKRKDVTVAVDPENNTIKLTVEDYTKK